MRDAKFSDIGKQSAQNEKSLLLQKNNEESENKWGLLPQKKAIFGQFSEIVGHFPPENRLYLRQSLPEPKNLLSPLMLLGN